MSCLRVKMFVRSVPEGRGYIGYRRLYEQRLQKKIGPFWWTIDKEEVPDDVIISLGCSGHTGGWKSRFAAHIH